MSEFFVGSVFCLSNKTVFLMQYFFCLFVCLHYVDSSEIFSSWAVQMIELQYDVGDLGLTSGCGT